MAERGANLPAGRGILAKVLRRPAASPGGKAGKRNHPEAEPPEAKESEPPGKPDNRVPRNRIPRERHD